MVSESEEYLLKALDDYIEISEKDKQILKKILKRCLFSHMDYNFNDYDAIFEKDVEQND